MTPTPLPPAVQCALDSADRLNRRFRILIWVLSIALLGSAVYFGLATPKTDPQDLLARGLLIIAIMIVLVAIRLRQSIELNGQILLRAVYAQRNFNQQSAQPNQ